MTQKEDDCLNNQPTSGTAGFSNAMVDRIVHDKIQEFINQMVPFYQSSYEYESVNDKSSSQNISTAISSNAVTLESIKQMFQKMIQD